MTRLSEGQAELLLVVLVLGAMVAIVACARSLAADPARPARTVQDPPTLWERHTARLTLWFGPGEPLSPPAQAYLDLLVSRRQRPPR